MTPEQAPADVPSLDPMLGAVPMTCFGDYSTPTLVACGATCQEAQAAVTQSLTDWANDDCAPFNTCNLGYAYKWGAPGCGSGCGVFGVAGYGCTGFGAGGGGGGGCGGPCDP